MLELTSLAFNYFDQPLLKAVSFAVKPGQLLHIRGGNGSGKTTLLRLLAGLLQPHKGIMRWQGQNVKDDLSAYQQNLCYTGHKTGLNPALSVLENCLFDWQRDEQIPVESALKQFDLAHLSEKPVALLSEGQKRRTALVRLVLSRALLWLVDEPFVALDDRSQTVLNHCLRQHLEEGGLVVMTSHQPFEDPPENYLEYWL